MKRLTGSARVVEPKHAVRGRETTRAARGNGRKAGARGKRWRIPNVMPIGSDAPVSETLPLAVKKIAENLKPDKIILFGSYAYGTPTPDSDVDLLVVIENENTHRENYLAVSGCLIPRHFAVDIVLRTPEEVGQALAKGDYFIEEIMERGKTLYERANRMD